VQVGCDLERVHHRAPNEWESLLNGEGFKLASVVGDLVSEQLDVSATRVWTIHEALKKAGVPTTAPVVVDPDSEADWVVFRSGDAIAYSCVIAAHGAEPAMCIATALVAP
jgi:hypothetical protein